MKKLWLRWLSLIFGFGFLLFTAGCGGGSNTQPPPPPPPPAPAIAGVANASGTTITGAILDTAIVIQGENFGASPSVTIGGAVATVAPGSTDTAINTAVPDGAKTGSETITVSTTAGSASFPFTVWGKPSAVISAAAPTCVINQPCNLSTTVSNVQSCTVTLTNYGTNNVSGDQFTDQAGAFPFTYDGSNFTFTGQPTADSLSYDINTGIIGNSAVWNLQCVADDGHTTTSISTVQISTKVPLAPAAPKMNPDTFSPTGSWTVIISSDPSDNNGFGSFVSRNINAQNAQGYWGSTWGDNYGTPNQPPSCGAGLGWLDPQHAQGGITNYNTTPGQYEFIICNAGISPTDNSAGGNTQSLQPGMEYIVASSSNIQQSGLDSVQLVSAGGQKGGQLLIYGQGQKIAAGFQLTGEISGFAADGKWAYVPNLASSEITRVNLGNLRADVLVLPHGLHPALVAANSSAVFVTTAEGKLLELNAAEKSFSILPAKALARTAAVWDGMLVIILHSGSALELVSKFGVAASYQIGLKKADKIVVVDSTAYIGALNSRQVAMIDLGSGLQKQASLAKGLWNFSTSGGTVYASEDGGKIERIAADGTVSGYADVRPRDLVNGFVVKRSGVLVESKDRMHLTVLKVSPRSQ